MPVKRWVINRDRVAWQLVGGQAVVVDLLEGKALGLNASGSLVWEMLPNSTEEEIAIALQGRFGGSAGQILTDVQRLLEELAQRGLILEAGETLDVEPDTACQRHFSQSILDVMRRQR